jgi:hypothetical protein
MPACGGSGVAARGAQAVCEVDGSPDQSIPLEIAIRSTRTRGSTKQTNKSSKRSD